MRGGWAIWLVAGTGSLAAHLGLVTALSGMTLEPPPPLAELSIGDAASEAPLEIEAVAEDEAMPLEADTSEAQPIAAAPADPQAVEETPVTDLAEAVTPAEIQSASAGEIEPRLSQLRVAEEAKSQAALDAPAELPEAQTSPLAENDGRAPELVPDEAAAAPAPAEPQPAEAEPADSSAAKVEPEISSATDNAGASPVAEIDTSAPALDPSADTLSTPAAETASEVGKAEPKLSASTEAVAPKAAESVAGTESTVAAPETTTAQTVAESGTPSVESASSAAAAVAATSPRQEPEEPVASAAALPQDTTTRVEQEQQMAALPPVSELPMTRRDRIGRFLRDGFDGGACLFVEVAGLDRDRPRLNGFVTAADAIPRIGNAFRRSVGVQPEIAMRQMMEAQCPAVDFIGRLKRNRAPSIVVRLAADVVRGSDLLVGRLTRATLPYTLLFIVDDDGIVHNLTDDLLPDVDGQTFAAEIHHTAEGKSRNQLIVAVGSTAPLEVPGPRRVGDAAPFLERLQAEAAAAGAKLSLGYATFRVE